MSTIICFIQARHNSTRLPGKIDMDLGGKPVKQWVIDAALSIPGVGGLRVLYPDEYPHVEENDVLGRFWAARQTVTADAIMRLTADCPLIDPQVCGLVVKAWENNGEYASNIYPRRTWPDGMDCEVFSVALLGMAHHRVTDPYDREHVTPWMQRNCSKIASVELPVDWGHVRLTVDTLRDLLWLREAVSYHRGESGEWA